MLRVFHQAFGVKLHRQKKWQLGRFIRLICFQLHRFDNSVFRSRHGGERFRGFQDTLVV